MEILIRIPPWAVTAWESTVDQCRQVSNLLSNYGDNVLQFLSHQRNAFAVALSVIFFYPFYFYCFVAVTTASTWIFWLLASIIMGVLQMIYVTYQFVMISMDIFVLTLLKTYQVLMRSRVSQSVFFFSKRIRTSRQRLSRRREWRARCEAAKNYQDYVQIPILESKSGSSGGLTTTAPVPPVPLRKSLSFATMETLKEEQQLQQQQQQLYVRESNTSSSSSDEQEQRDHDHNDDEEEAPQGSGGMGPSGSPPRSNSNSSSNKNISPSKRLPPKRRSSLSKLKALQEEQARTEVDPDIKDDLGPSTTDLLLSTTARLKEERLKLKQRRRSSSEQQQSQALPYCDDTEKSPTTDDDDAGSALEFLLSGVVKRNHLTLEDLLVTNARSVAVSGQYEFSKATRKAIGAYYEEVTKGLECLVEAPSSSSSYTSRNGMNHHHLHDSSMAVAELQGRIKLLRKMKQNTGRTALMLSGGGAQAMYHLGTVRALIQSDLYRDIRVISGTSGGSIAAACCACYTQEEILNDICVSTVSTDFRLNGEMKRRNIRWFPPVADMVSYWFKHRLLVDSKYFFTTCEYYWGNTTFAEAFERTGKHVCITVSASRANSGSAQRLLLNHISTPHVTLASAVAASCALPGVMKPRKLQAKNSQGKIEDFEVDGVEWIDGSVQADLPFQRISTLFNVSNYVVCQTNFHVLPFLNKEHHPNSKSTYWKLFQTIEWDIRNRALKLSRLGLFPKIFGQDISKVFKQKYHGNLTLVPRFTAMQTFGLQALVNPTCRDMDNYLKFGQVAAWPYLRVMRDMLCLERSLDEGLDRLKSRIHELRPDTDLSETAEDDLDSIASSTVVSHYNSHAHYYYHTAANGGSRGVRFGASSLSGREIETLQNKLSRAQEQNRMLRQEVQELRSVLDRAGIQVQDYISPVRDADGAPTTASASIWNSEDEKKADDKDLRFAQGSSSLAPAATAAATTATTTTPRRSIIFPRPIPPTATTTTTPSSSSSSTNIGNEGGVFNLVRTQANGSQWA